MLFTTTVRLQFDRAAIIRQRPLRPYGRNGRCVALRPK